MINNNKCIFFVYGTLKSNNYNHRYLGNSEFLMEFTTEPNYTLYDGGFPVVERGGNGSIKGELYLATDKEVIDNIFDLEQCFSKIQGDPLNWYDYDIIDTPHGEAVLFVMNKDKSGRTKILKNGIWN